MKKIGQGKTAEVFDLGDGHVLKLFFPENRGQLETELQIHRMVIATGFPTAGVEQVVHFNGRDGILFINSLVGPSMNQVIWKSPWKSIKMARTLAEVHAHIHSFNAPHLPCVTDRLYRQISNEKAFSPSIRNYLTDKIDNLPKGNALCHGDLHLNNVILHSEKPFVIDWCRATRGNPLCDVAKTVAVLQLENATDSSAYRLCIKPFRKLFIQTYLSHYKKLTGIDTSSLNEIIEPIELEILLRKEPEHRNRIIRLVKTGYKNSLMVEHERTE